MHDFLGSLSLSLSSLLLHPTFLGFGLGEFRTTPERQKTLWL